MKTLIIGASENPERYSYRAIKKLVDHGHEVTAIGLKPGEVAGVNFQTDKIDIPQLDTVTLYVGPKNQPEYYEYIIGLKPRRIIFNPGTENPEFIRKANQAGIKTEIACTLVLLGTGQF